MIRALPKNLPFFKGFVSFGENYLVGVGDLFLKNSMADGSFVKDFEAFKKSNLPTLFNFI